MQPADKLALSLALSEMTFLSFREKTLLSETLANVAELARLSIDDISKMTARTIRAASWQTTRDGLERRAAQIDAIMQAFNVRPLFFHDEAYPVLLHELFDPPFLLFYRGECAVLNNCVSVVGTRKPTRSGMEAAYNFSVDAANDGLTIVSGLAFGIDSCAHKGALSVNGATAAVLACGVDRAYPVSNRRIAETILTTGGCLVSEYPPGAEPLTWRFPQRNRIIAGLSAATVVIEAPAGSGALITADFALEQGRDVYFHQAAVHAEQNAVVRAEDTPVGAKKKAYRSVKAYCADGAPIIDSYKQYCEYAATAPEHRHNSQGELF